MLYADDMNKYEFLTKDVLQQDYNELGNFKRISEKYEIPRSTIERYCKVLGVITTPKFTYNVNHDIFSEDTEVSLYLAGFIAADGCVYCHKSDVPNNMQITLSAKDESHLQLLRNLMCFTGPITRNIRKLSKMNPKWNDAEMVSISVYSKQIITDLATRFGIGPRKSLTYEFPQRLIDHPLVHHFMRGYFDGDGSFYETHESRKTKTKGMRTYSKFIFGLRGSIRFLTLFKVILNNSNIHINSVPKMSNGTGVLTLSGNRNVKRIANFLYHDSNQIICLHRKFEKVSKI